MSAIAFAVKWFAMAFATRIVLAVAKDGCVQLMKFADVFAHVRSLHFRLL